MYSYLGGLSPSATDAVPSQGIQIVPQYKDFPYSPTHMPYGSLTHSIPGTPSGYFSIQDAYQQSRHNCEGSTWSLRKCDGRILGK